MFTRSELLSWPSSAKKRRELFWCKWVELFRNRCFYCCVTIHRTLPDAHPRRATIDHVVPLSAGGVNALTNKVWCCRQCNATKGAQLLAA